MGRRCRRGRRVVRFRMAALQGRGSIIAAVGPASDLHACVLDDGCCLGVLMPWHAWFWKGLLPFRRAGWTTGHGRDSTSLASVPAFCSGNCIYLMQEQYLHKDSSIFVPFGSSEKCSIFYRRRSNFGSTLCHCKILNCSELILYLYYVMVFRTQLFFC
ncbi:hypothetical protein PVAP13_8KG148900 [Panicum virgatum]|uniref:Uncharacterized protein n=1 Tax=Panicum virgatum TaxID=38727 RepID=A0A8T0PGG5_PANVG|nr:hypothetical protein PVAP13_8KG148900 [Panicum virgatum]